MRLIGYVLLLVTAGLTIWQVAWLGIELADPVASHFDLMGRPDGYMKKSSFLAMHCGLQALMAVMMLGIAYGMRWIPEALLNMPHKEYWLHKDRRSETLAANASLMIFIAGVTGLFLSVVFQLVYAANVQNAGQLDSWQFGVALGIYVLVIVGLVGATLWRFRLPRNAETGETGEIPS